MLHHLIFFEGYSCFILSSYFSLWVTQVAKKTKQTPKAHNDHTLRMEFYRMLIFHRASSRSLNLVPTYQNLFQKKGFFYTCIHFLLTNIPRKYKYTGMQSFDATYCFVPWRLLSFCYSCMYNYTLAYSPTDDLINLFCFLFMSTEGKNSPKHEK